MAGPGLDWLSPAPAQTVERPLGPEVTTPLPLEAPSPDPQAVPWLRPTEDSPDVTPLPPMQVEAVADVAPLAPSGFLDGLPPGAAATLMGGAWAVTFPIRAEAITAALAAFHFKVRVVPAVSPATPGPSSDLPRHTPEGNAALAAYQHLGSPRHSLMEDQDGHRHPKVDVLD